MTRRQKQKRNGNGHSVRVGFTEWPNTRNRKKGHWPFCEGWRRRSIDFHSTKNFKKSNDFKAWGGLGTARHSESLDIELKSLRKVTISRLGADRGRPGIENVSIFN